MKSAHYFKAGDVLLCSRVLYKHYGIYAGGGRVIHYAAARGDFGSDVKVRETSLKQFSRGGKCQAAFFPKNSAGEGRFSPEETVRRARSRIGEESYNLLFNNCEHFALWCKCGTSKSVQVKKAVAVAVVLGTAVLAAQLVKLTEDI